MQLRRHLFHRHCRLLSGMLLVALLLQAYIPAGFMPASGAPFLLEVCPTGLAPLSAQHAHHHPGMGFRDGVGQGATGHDGHGSFEQCPFGSAPAAGPLTHFTPPTPPSLVAQVRDTGAFSLPIHDRLSRAHQARGPPLLS